jgi:quercetin dioxygenase-like cupin family protein
MECGFARVVDNLASLELGEPGQAAGAVYDRTIGLRLLHEDRDSGEEHYLIHYPAGTKGRIHRHTAAHTIVVLQGRLEVNGEIIRSPAYAHFPAGEPMRHQAAGDDGCLFVIMFHGPFDVQILAD